MGDTKFAFIKLLNVRLCTCMYRRLLAYQSYVAPCLPLNASCRRGRLGADAADPGTCVWAHQGWAPGWGGSRVWCNPRVGSPAGSWGPEFLAPWGLIRTRSQSSPTPSVSIWTENERKVSEFGRNCMDHNTREILLIPRIINMVSAALVTWLVAFVSINRRTDDGVGLVYSVQHVTRRASGISREAMGDVYLSSVYAGESHLEYAYDRYSRWLTSERFSNYSRLQPLRCIL